MNFAKVPIVLGTVMAVSLVTGGCATKKHVREAIAPVQNQVNDVQKQGNENKQSIGELDRQVATADEKATDAGKRASQANDLANTANSAAMTAQQRADAANGLAQQAQQGISRIDQSLQNLDNYRLVNTQQVFFKPGRSVLDKEGKAELDSALTNLSNPHNIVIEVEGFADRSGAKAMNVELSRKRADAVVRYLTVEHNIPLRDIRMLGVGSDFPNAVNRTRADRKQNRRVDVKVYALDITGNGAGQVSSTNHTNDSSNGADRMRTDQSTPSMPRSTNAMPRDSNPSRP
jgi:outer membrane protein OmpA-like peptidoglycan-associated protein